MDRELRVLGQGDGQAADQAFRRLRFRTGDDLAFFVSKGADKSQPERVRIGGVDFSGKAFQLFQIAALAYIMPQGSDHSLDNHPAKRNPP